MKRRLNLNISDFCDDGKYARSYWVWLVDECKFNQRFFLFFARTQSIMDPARDEQMTFFFYFVEIIRLCHCHTYWWFGLFWWLPNANLFDISGSAGQNMRWILSAPHERVPMCTRRSFYHVQCINHRLNLNYVPPFGERGKCTLYMPQ